MASIQVLVATKADEIEAEMRRLGWWDAPPPPAEAFQSREAFFADTMSYHLWLRYVFMPRVRELIASGNRLPDRSHVAVRAAREFDGEDVGRLVTLLSQFDELIGRPKGVGLLSRLFRRERS